MIKTILNTYILLGNFGEQFVSPISVTFGIYGFLAGAKTDSEVQLGIEINHRALPVPKCRIPGWILSVAAIIHRYYQLIMVISISLAEYYDDGTSVECG